MALSKGKIAVVVLALSVALAGFACVVQQALAQKPPQAGADGQKNPPAPHASQLDLSPKTWAKLRTTIGPQGNEWRHLRVLWYTDIVAARKKAAAEDRPILVFRTGGAGYNDPLGQC